MGVICSNTNNVKLNCFITTYKFCLINYEKKVYLFRKNFLKTSSQMVCLLYCTMSHLLNMIRERYKREIDRYFQQQEDVTSDVKIM